MRYRFIVALSLLTLAASIKHTYAQPYSNKTSTEVEAGGGAESIAGQGATLGKEQLAETDEAKVRKSAVSIVEQNVTLGGEQALEAGESAGSIVEQDVTLGGEQTVQTDSEQTQMKTKVILDTSGESSVSSEATSPTPLGSDLEEPELLQPTDADVEQPELQADEKPARRGMFKKIGDYFKNSNEDKTYDKKFDFSIIGGPHYSSDTKFGLGLVAAGLFRTGSSPTFKQPSNVSIYGDITTSGFWALGLRGNTIFKEGLHRLDYVASFSHMPTNFWGLGYEMGRDNSNKTSFDQDQVNLRIDYMIRIARNLYLGTNVSFNHTKVSDFGNTAIILDQRRKYTNTGLGFFLLYDSRDAYTAAHRGWFFKVENIDFPEFLGNKMEFNSSELTLNFYHPIWKGAVMAYDLHGVYKDGEVPWTMLARMGGSSRMRGYYEGRYRDKGLLEIQAELRQNIWRRIGVTAWVGAGNVFHEFSKINMSHTLYNYGVGLRWEFKKRVNVRLDYGIGKGESSFIFSINEAF